MQPCTHHSFFLYFLFLKIFFVWLQVSRKYSSCLPLGLYYLSFVGVIGKRFCELGWIWTRSTSCEQSLPYRKWRHLTTLWGHYHNIYDRPRQRCRSEFINKTGIACRHCIIHCLLAGLRVATGQCRMTLWGALSVLLFMFIICMLIQRRRMTLQFIFKDHVL
jgi:hypothetical protein